VPELLQRTVVPSRLNLIYRDGETLAYNPALNVWHRLDAEHAEAIRWLRAGRPRAELGAHLDRRFGTGPTSDAHRVERLVSHLLLRRLLYLDKEPPDPEYQPPPDPLSAVYWICTQKCNLRCTYCYQEASVARPYELSTDEAYSLVDQAVEAGADTFVFTGGEPFSRRDLLEVARYSKASGLRTNVITNGGYIREKTIDAIAETFDLVTISLDHVRPEHHDRFRGPGTWQRASTAMDLLLEAGVSVDINSTLTHPGLGDLSELLALSREKAIGQHKIVPQFPMGRADEHPGDELTPDELLGVNDDMRAIVERLDTATPDTVRVEGRSGDKRTIRGHCGAGLSEVSVDPEGWVYPCKLLQYPKFRTANIRDVRLADIYAREPVLRDTRATTARELQPCATCTIRASCGGGCRGIHYSFTNDYIKAHPLFCAYLRRSFEVRAWASTGKVPRRRRTKFGERPSTETAP
jgi:radical SAM protein with 4Fe4S-binding SPASM domain